MRKVVWSTKALDEFNTALDFIASDSSQNADLVADRIEAAAKLLGQMPIGRPGKVAGSYEKPVLRTPFVIVYALGDHAITILRIIHGARDWPEGEWPAE
jgi:toxin ParE1/3/4